MTNAKILIVDDDPDVLALVKNRLESENYEVVTARDGEDALYKARKIMPDLIVLDVMMPVIDGYEVCARLKRDLNLCHTPVFMLTSRGKYLDKRIGEKCGADRYIIKPYNGPILMREVKKFLEKEV